MRPVARRVGILVGALAAAAAVAAPAADAARLHPVMSGLDEPTYVTGTAATCTWCSAAASSASGTAAGSWRARSSTSRRHVTTAGDEQGLLSMAFAPHFDRNHRVYVDFTNLNGDTRVVQYRTFAGNRNRVNPATKRVLLKVGQPFDNHNGGQLQIGPDGLLYISLGDGGSAGDPNLNGQSKGPLVDDPADRPAKAPPPRRRCTRTACETRGGSRSTGRPAACGSATSARTRWRRSTTSATTPPAGTNFGWSFYEGRSMFKNAADRPVEAAVPGRGLPPRRRRAPTTARSPAATSTAGARSRGSQGQYLYADFCSGRIWKIPSRGGRPTLTNMSFKASSISSFGEGSNGELYVVSLGGTIYKIVR